MKTAVAYQNRTATRRAPAYPNAASFRQVLHRIVDLLLCAAIGAAIAAILLLMIV